MISIKKYAAIDIGSNAIRLLVANVIEKEDKEPQFKKSSLIRVPIRLGADSFVEGKISEENGILTGKTIPDIYGESIIGAFDNIGNLLFYPVNRNTAIRIGPKPIVVPSVREYIFITAKLRSI